MSNEKIELDREDVIALIDICGRAIGYEESLRGHYEVTFTTTCKNDQAIRDIWKLKYKLRNLLNDEKEKENETRL